jgi:hypothetical protein
MKPNNDTALSPIVCTLLLLALTVVLVSPVVAENVTYPQEYYTNGIYTDSVNTYLLNAAYLKNDLDADDILDILKQTRNLDIATFLELRRQTILMEKQNELIAEQNELMGRLVNATEIKFVCTATGYVTEPTHFNVDDMEVSPSFNSSDYHYNISPSDVVQCANLSYFERANYGFPLY